jgi:hypothetical protein
MSDQTSRQASAGGGSAAPPAAALPDINAETYPFETVVQLLDQAAFLSMFSIPARDRSIAIPSRNGAGIAGLRIKEQLHRLSRLHAWA